MKEARITAIHEASHVVLIVATIGPSHVGRCMLCEQTGPRSRVGDARLLHAPTLEAIRKMREVFPRFAELSARHMIAIFLAGHIGAHIAQKKKHFRVPLRGDVSRAMPFAIGIGPRVFAEELRRVRRVLERHWKHVRRLADALLERRRLTGREALAVLDAAGPVRPLRRRPLDRLANDELHDALLLRRARRLRAHRSR